MNRIDADRYSTEKSNSDLVQSSSTFLIFFSQPVEEQVKKKISMELISVGSAEFPESNTHVDTLNEEYRKDGGNSCKLIAIADRQISPDVIQAQAERPVFDSMVLINPEFRAGLAGKFHLLEIPVLIITSALLDWNVRSQATSYHDLISGSEMIIVRSSATNPLLELRSQVFNAIIKFEKNAI